MTNLKKGDLVFHIPSQKKYIGIVSRLKISKAEVYWFDEPSRYHRAWHLISFLEKVNKND